MPSCHACHRATQKRRGPSRPLLILCAALLLFITGSGGETYLFSARRGPIPSFPPSIHGGNPADEAGLPAEARDPDRIAEAVSEIVSNLSGTPSRFGLYSGPGGLGVSDIRTLVPFFEHRRTAVFAQLGGLAIRTDETERWIGNAGLGQRWFPQETAWDSYFGYNLFVDHDFDRALRRGGIGAELRHSLLSITSNYYFPISGWQTDVEDKRERPLKGWDAQVRSELPFFRNVAATGAYSRWSRSPGATIDASLPTAWSYGLELTPHPAVSAFINRRRLDEETRDVQFGIQFSWDFGLPEQPKDRAASPFPLSPAGGADGHAPQPHRHRFIERNNALELEYSWGE